MDMQGKGKGYSRTGNSISKSSATPSLEYIPLLTQKVILSYTWANIFILIVAYTHNTCN